MEIENHGEYQGERAARTQRPNKKQAPCSRCGRTIPPGEGRVWRCWRPGRCATPELCRDGWHCECLDEKACKARAKERAWINEQLKRNIVQLVATDWLRSDKEQRITASMVSKCTVVRVGDEVMIKGGSDTIKALKEAKCFESVQAATKGCAAKDDAEYSRVTLRLEVCSEKRS